MPSSPPIIQNIVSLTPRSLRITWTEIDSGSWHGQPSGYCVTYQERGSTQNNIQNISNPLDTSTIITYLKPHTLYYVQVAARTGAGCGVKDRSSLVTKEDGK